MRTELIGITTRTYTYDAESRITSISGDITATYVYDAFGRRIRKASSEISPAREYFYDLSGRMVMETSGASGGVWLLEYYAGGMHVGTYTYGHTFFSHQDYIGTERVRTDETGLQAQSCTYGPFGDNEDCNGSLSPYGGSIVRYAGYERDPESGLDHMWFRYYNPRLGRFMTTDPYGGSMDIGDPQSINRYAYVGGNPVNAVDPLGLTELCWTDDNGTQCINVVHLENVTVSAGGNGHAPGAGAGLGRANPGLLQDMGDPIGGGVGFGIRAPGQTFGQCMNANANTYSMAGAAELTANVITGTSTSYSSNDAVGAVAGNNLNTFLFGSGTGAAASMAASTPGAVAQGIGTAASHGRRTSEILSLNLSIAPQRAPGGLPYALGKQASGGVKAVLGGMGKALSLGLSFSTKLAIDTGLTGAMAVNCSLRR